MSETQALAMVMLLAVGVGCLLLLLLMGVRVERRLRRIEQVLKQRSVAGTTPISSTTAGEFSHGGAFESFLKEDPSRKALSKSEQLSAYRRWRQEHGMNWSKPNDEGAA